MLKYFPKFGNKNAYILAKWMKDHYLKVYPGAANFIDAVKTEDMGSYGTFREGYDAAGIRGRV